MTLEELYGKVLADEELKNDLAKAIEGGKLVEWVNDQGVDATEEDIKAFIDSAANEKISVDDVDQVAGGGYSTAWSFYNKTFSLSCSIWPLC